MTSLGTLLIVDDEENIRQSLSYLFEGFTLFAASNGEEALDVVRKHPEIEVIISDQRMPKLSGSEFLKQAKDILPHASRILLTGYADIDATIDSVNSGEIFRYILKPWNRERLVSTVEAGVKLCRSSKVTIPKTPTPAVIPSKPSDFLVQSPSAPKAPLELIQTRAHVLIIDHNERHLQAFKEFLSSDYDVHIATDALSGYDYVVKNPISVIITEVSSDMQSFRFDDFISAIKHQWPDIVVMVLTESRDAEIAIKMVNQASIFRYLIKPFKRSYLQESLLEAIALSQRYKDNPQLNPYSVLHQSVINSALSDEKNPNRVAVSLAESFNNARSSEQRKKTY